MKNNSSTIDALSNEKQKLPETSSNPFESFLKKHKILLILISVSILILVPVSVFLSTLFFHSKEKTTETKEETHLLSPEDIELRTLSSSEWDTVLVSAKEKLSTEVLGQMSSYSNFENPLDEETSDSFNQKISSNFAVKTLPTSQEDSYTQEKIHLGLELEGLVVNDNLEEMESTLLLSYFGINDFETNRTQSDLIVSGSLGDMNFQATTIDIDALHISIINPNQQTSLVKIDSSDGFLVFLDRNMHPEKEKSNGEIIVETRDIYSYFGNYVEIEQEINELTSEAQLIRNDTTVFLESTFMETIADIDTYIVSSEEKSLQTGFSEFGIITISIDQDKFIEVLGNYISHIKEYFDEKKTEYTQVCGENEDCLESTGYMTPEQIETNFETLTLMSESYTITKAGIIVDKEDLEFKGLIIETEKNPGLPFIVESLLDISKVSFSFYLDKLKDKVNIFEPSKIYTLEEDLPDFYYSNVDEGNNLYTENKSYMRSLGINLWEAILEHTSSFCNIWWEPGFCFPYPKGWTVSAPSAEGSLSEYSSIVLHYPSDSSSEDQEISIFIYPTSYTYQNICSYEENTSVLTEFYSEFKDIVTNQGTKLRISSTGVDNDNNEFVGEICIENEDEYSTKLPFAGRIEIYGNEIGFDEAASHIEEVLETIEVE